MKGRTIIPALLVMTILSCTMNKQEVLSDTGELVFSVFPGNEETKVQFGSKSESGYPLLWSDGDRINVNGVTSSALSSEEAGKKNARFTVAGVSSPYTVIHPASAYREAGKVMFASVQNHRAGSCPLATTVLSRRTDDNQAVILDNLCGYLRLNINRSTDMSQFSRIEFSGNNNEDVAGVFSVTYDSDGHPVPGEATSGKKMIALSSISETGEYIITVPAMTFTKGFTVDVIDVNNHYMRIKTNSSVKIASGVLVDAPAVTYLPNGTIIGGDTPSTSDFIVHTALQMNTDVVKDSHAGEELKAGLQKMHKYSQLIPNRTLEPELYAKEGYEEQKYATYPRIKRMADGRFIMFYHGGQYGSRIWFTVSKDYINWSTPRLLFEPIRLTEPAEVAGDYRVFVNPDAVILGNGDILLVCSYRAKNHYSEGLDGGLAFRTSTDNGNTWSSPLYVPVGSNWEPYILQLNDGTLQCYFTDAIPQTRNSGTGMIASTDGGKTWSPKIRTCQRYKYAYKTQDSEKSVYNGQIIYTDQMPCFRQLNDGSLVGFLEDRLENPTPSDCADEKTYNSYCSMSLVYNSGTTWTNLTDFSSPNQGPSDRQQVIKYGAGGYIATFGSGETAFSCSIDQTCKINLSDNTARNFKSSDWKSGVYAPFSYKGFWPCIESFCGNCLATAMHSRTETLSVEFKEEEYPGMQLAMYYLNHRVEAPAESIVVDGNANEWQNTEALYVSAPSGEEAILRAARDASNLYLAVEMEDNARNANNYVHVNLAFNNAKKVEITFNCNAMYSPKTTSGVSMMMSKGTTKDGKKGFVNEICVPLSLIGSLSAGDEIKCYMDLKINNVLYPFDETVSSDISSWKTIRLK